LAPSAALSCQAFEKEAGQRFGRESLTEFLGNRRYFRWSAQQLVYPTSRDTPMDASLKNRFDALHREMVEQFDRTAAVEHHWLIYALLGWEHLVACAVSHYLVQVKELQEPRWIYVAVWLVQIFVAVATIKLISGRPRIQESPIEPINKRIWTMFLFLCINIAVLNVISGQPIFVFMPALAALSSFGFTFMTSLISRRFMAAGLVMFATGVLMAKFRSYEFLIYGSGWLIVLQTLSVILWQRRRILSGDRVATEPSSLPLSGRLLV
jgi:hypothetical protein